MKKKLLTLLFISFILILSACGDSDSDETKDNEENVISVETAEVKKGDLKVKKSFYGQTQPIKQTPVIVSTPGELKALRVTNSNKVDKGDDLAVIESTVPAQPQAMEQPPTELSEEPAEPEDEIVEETIEAPSKGTVASLSQSLGTFVSSEEPLMMIVDLDKIKVQATTTQKSRDLFNRNQEVDIDINEKKYTGKVLSLDPMPNENGEYVLDLRVDNPDNKISSGESAKITLNRTLKEDVLIVPSEAVMTTDEEEFVYVVNDSKAEKVKIDVLEVQTKETAIKAKLKKGDEIVINGQSLLSDNAEVMVKDDEEDKKNEKDNDNKKDGNNS